MPNGMNSSDSSSAPPALQPENELDGLLVERVVLDRLRHAQVRLQRDVAEIFEDEDAQIVCVPRDRRNRQRDVRQEPETLTNGSSSNVNGAS